MSMVPNVRAFEVRLHLLVPWNQRTLLELFDNRILEHRLTIALKTWTVLYVTLLFINITKTYLYNFDPLKPHFYIVKLGFTGVYIIFLFSAQNIDFGYSLEPPRRGGSNGYPQSMF